MLIRTVVVRIIRVLYEMEVIINNKATINVFNFGGSARGSSTNLGIDTDSQQTQLCRCIENLTQSSEPSRKH